MVNEIKKLFDAFVAEAQKGEVGNKAAAKRSRKISNEITKVLKEYRKESVEKCKA